MPPSRPSGVRLFVAVDPPVDVRHALAGWLREQRGVHALVRPVEPEQLHLTLAFLGLRPAGEVDRIADLVADVGATASCLGLSLGAPLWLPPRRPRALTVEVHDDRGDLAALHRSLSDALREAIGWREERPLRPHLTVGRRNPAVPLPTRPLAPTPGLTFDGAALTLYRSTLDPEGARYGVVERVDLT